MPERVPLRGTRKETHYFLTDSEESEVIRMDADLESYEVVESDTANFLNILDDIRHHIATNEEGITRDEAIAEQMINLLICKMSSEDDGEAVFSNGDEPAEISKNIHEYFDQVVTKKYSDTLPNGGKIELTVETLAYIAQKIRDVHLHELGPDVLGEAFQFFITPVLKGSQGQFFTPMDTIKMMVDMVNPRPDEKVIDPACGTGGFLTAASAHSAKEQTFATGAGAGQAALTTYQDTGGEGGYFGIDKDEFLSEITQARSILSGNEPDHIFCENSLDNPTNWSKAAQNDIEFGTFDVVLTNPPFGAGQKIKDDEILEQYDLGHKWKSSGDGEWEQTSRTVNTAVQVLFIERCLQLLRPGGRMGIILPESLFGNPSYRYVMQFLEQNTKMHAVVAMPEELFQPYTHAKTCVLIAEKDENAKKEDHDIFMASAEWCGHDSRRNPTTKEDSEGTPRLLDDLPLIQQRYDRMVYAQENVEESSLGFFVNTAEIENSVYVPHYHDPSISDSFAALSKTHEMVKIGELLDEGIISINTGVEVGKMSYGTGDIPFIRTSDIANWETKIDPQHSVSEEIYEEYKDKADVQPQDILLVKDGTSLIGTSCMISEYDTKMLFQSHLYKIRVEESDELSPYELFGALNHPVVNEQIKARQFTQQIIDSLSKERLREVILPIPDDEDTREEFIREVREIIETRAKLKNDAQKLMQRDS